MKFVNLTTRLYSVLTEEFHWQEYTETLSHSLSDLTERLSSPQGPSGHWACSCLLLSRRVLNASLSAPHCYLSQFMLLFPKCCTPHSLLLFLLILLPLLHLSSPLLISSFLFFYLIRFLGTT